MNKKCLIITVILLSIIVAGFYKFILQGSVTESTDGRTEILLNDSERNLVLAEMRAFLTSVQQINQGISENNMELVAENARKSGKAAQAGMPGTLVGKLPLQFKKLGGDTHKKFDQLAMDADDLGDRDHALEQLSTLMQNCVACHAIYRIDI
jgi:mono/diheme cytochrome c family protein